MGIDFNAGFDAGQRSATRAMQDRIGAMEESLNALKYDNEGLRASLSEAKQAARTLQVERDNLRAAAQRSEATKLDFWISWMPKLKAGFAYQNREMAEEMQRIGFEIVHAIAVDSSSTPKLSEREILGDPREGVEIGTVEENMARFQERVAGAMRNAGAGEIEINCQPPDYTLPTAEPDFSPEAIADRVFRCHGCGTPLSTAPGYCESCERKRIQWEQGRDSAKSSTD